MLVFSMGVAVLVAAALYAFFRTNLGTAMQAAGDNAQMIRALGVNVEHMVVLGLALSNALVALAGALLAQYQGFADVQMGIGMVVWGLASIIIGEALVGARQLGFIIVGAIMGSVLFRLLVAIALRGGLNPNDLKLITAAFVFLAPRPAWRAAPAGRRVRRERADHAAVTDLFKTFNPGTPNEVRALQGVAHAGRGLVRHRDRQQRVGEVDAAQRGGGDVPRGPRLDPPRRDGRHRVARAPARVDDRPGVPEPVQRHGAVDVDRREPGAGGAPRAAARAGLGGEGAHARRASASASSS